MAKAKKAARRVPKETASIRYRVGDDHRIRELSLPVGHGRGEALLTAIEREGCTNINEVREQIKKLPHVSERK